MINIITQPFDSETQCFNDEALQRFLAGKTIKNVKPEFFKLDEQAYWTVRANYEPLIPMAEKAKHDRNFNPVQQQLVAEIQQWRKEKAELEKTRVYLIAPTRNLNPTKTVRDRPVWQ